MTLKIKNKQILVSSNFDVNSKKVVNVLAPFNDTDAANKKYVDDKQSSSVAIYTISPVIENTTLGTLNSGLTLGMMYITNTGNTTAYINLGTTTTGNEINQYDIITIPPDEVISITINRRLSNTENMNLYISANSWLGVDLTVEWAVITYESQINSGGGLLVQSGYNVYLYSGTATDYYIGNGDTPGLSLKDTETKFVYYDETTGRLSYGTGGATPVDDILYWNSNKYTPYSVSTAGKFDVSTTSPNANNRLNYNGYLYSTRLYEGTARVVTVNPTPALNQIATWSNGNSIQGSSSFTWNGTILGINGDINFSSSGNRTIKILDSSTGNGDSLSIIAGNATAGNNIGGLVNIYGGTGGVGGPGVPGGQGGNLNLYGGTGGTGGGADGGNGGNVYIYGGVGGVGDTYGGSVYITSGVGGSPGNIYFGTEIGGTLPISGVSDTKLIYYNPTSGQLSYGSVYDGNVSKIGTPFNNQVAVWTDSSTIEGLSTLTFDNSTGILSIMSGITFISGSTRVIKIEDKTTAGSGSDTQILGQTTTYSVAWAAGGALKLYGGNGNNVGGGGGDGGTTVVRGGAGGNADEGSGGGGGSVQIIGGVGGLSESSSDGLGGDVFIYGGTGASTGNVYFGTGSAGRLPSSSTANVVYYDSATGRISYGAPAGAGFGNVSSGGTTPTNNQIAVWTGSNTIEGTNNFTFDDSTGILSVKSGITLSSGANRFISMPSITNSSGYGLTISGQTVTSGGGTGGPITIIGGNGGNSSGFGSPGGNVTIQGGIGGTTTTGGVGGDVTILGGHAGGGTTGNGGNVYIYGGLDNNGSSNNVYFGTGSAGKLPSSSTSNVVYYDTATGRISYGAISGGGFGNVSSGGTTPQNDQVAVWTGSNTIEGTQGLTFNSSGILGVSNRILFSSGGTRIISIANGLTTNTLQILGQTNVNDSSTTGGDVNVIGGAGAGTSGGASGGNGGDLILKGGAGGSSSTGADGAGGHTYLVGGSAGGSSSESNGGSVFIYPGENAANNGNIYFGTGSAGKLPLKTSETNVVYYNPTTGLLSYSGITNSAVSKTGTVASNQVAVWNSDGVLRGSNNLTFTGSYLTVGTIASQNTIRIYGNSTSNQTPVLSLYRSGLHDTYITDVGNYMTFGFDPASYNDADLTSAYGMTLDSTGNLNVKTSISVAGNNIGNIYATKLANILYVTSTPTLTASDNNKIITCDTGSGNYSINLPAGMPTGWQVTIVNVGTSVITVASSVTLLQSKNYYKLTQYAAASTFYNGTNYYLFGDLSA